MLARHDQLRFPGPQGRAAASHTSASVCQKPQAQGEEGGAGKRRHRGQTLFTLIPSSCTEEEECWSERTSAST